MTRGRSGSRCSPRRCSSSVRCSSRDPDTRSTKSSRSLPFAASRRPACRFCLPGSSTIAARLFVRELASQSLPGSDLVGRSRREPLLGHRRAGTRTRAGWWARVGIATAGVSRGQPAVGRSRARDRLRAGAAIVVHHRRVRRVVARRNLDPVLGGSNHRSLLRSVLPVVLQRTAGTCTLGTSALGIASGTLGTLLFWPRCLQVDAMSSRSRCSRYRRSRDSGRDRRARSGCGGERGVAIGVGLLSARRCYSCCITWRRRAARR